MARRFGRRRRPNVQWMPVYGDHGLDTNAENDRAVGVRTTIEVPTDGSIRWDAVSLTYDYSDSAGNNQLDQERTLHDIVEGGEWRLRRIVGKLFANWDDQSETSGNQVPLIDYAAGFIVCRTDDDGNPTTDFNEVNPLTQDAAEDPWIFRRRWLLSTVPERGTSQVFNSVGLNTADYYASGMYPSSTAGYHSVADGPHIDQKTARRIHRSERLFFVQAVRGYNTSEITVYARWGELHSLLDYRLLGSITRSSPGNRRNAAR